MSGPDVNIPPPTPAEEKNTELQNKAAERSMQLQEQYYAEQQKLKPYYYRDMGLKLDANGNPVEDTESEAYRSKQIAKAADARVMAALQGKLDVDPSVEADITRGEDQLKEELNRRLGPGAEGGDTWNRAIAEYRRGANSLRYSVRHGEMSSADALSLNRQNETTRKQQIALSSLTNPYTGAANLLTTTSTIAGNAYDRAAGERYKRADMAFESGKAGLMATSGIIGSTIGAAGTAAGAYYGAKS